MWIRYDHNEAGESAPRGEKEPLAAILQDASKGERGSYMYKRILVTLDESELAEQALPHAVAVAQHMDAVMELLSVVPAVDDDLMRAAGAAFDWEAHKHVAEEYLQGIQARVEAEGIRCTIAVRQGDVADEILRYCGDTGRTLIVMSTHGRSGLGRWVYGSIADRVLRYAEVPVLLIRAEEED